ncbi:MAG: tetratricopeptide repeat protein [Phycisphaeraceae bacterium]|nr:tetratricopeptide repeat protein [Phycisphaeraceae bacterium]
MTTEPLLTHPNPSPNRHLLKAGLLVLLAVIAYTPSLSNGFIWDDDGYVQANPNLQNVQGLIRIWTVRGATPQYYPLVHSTFWAEYQCWKLWAPGYHSTNLVLHITASLLWWWLLVSLGLKRIAWLAATIFALHPIHVETVCWITERKNVLSLVCYLLAALSYLHFANRPRPHFRRQWVWYFVALIFFISALLSKTVTTTFPAAMVLVLWVRQCSSSDSLKTVIKRLPWKHVGLLVPFFILGIMLSRITLSMETTEVGARGAAWDQNLLERIIIYGRVVLFYAQKVIFPDVFMFNYPRWDITSHNFLLYLFPFAAVIIGVVFWTLRKRITLWPLAGYLFTVGTLLPASGLFDVYPMRFSYVADHFAYHATMGIIASAAAALYLLTQRFNAITRRTFFAVIFALLMVQTMRYTPAYANWFTLFSDTLNKNPNSWMAYNYRGAAWEKLYDHTQHPQALQNAYDDYQQGLEHHQQFAQLHANYASVLIKKGEPQNAIAPLQIALKLQPDLPQGHYWFGLALRQTDQLPQAAKHFQEAVSLFPAYVSAWHYLGRTLQNLNHIDPAIHAYQQAITLRPHAIGAYQELGLLMLNQKHYAKAQPYFEQVLKIRPNEPAAWWSLGLTRYMLSDTASAIELLEKAMAQSPDNALKYDLAWILVTCPEPQFKNRDKARQITAPLPNSPSKAIIELAITQVQKERPRQLLRDLPNQ